MFNNSQNVRFRHILTVELNADLSKLGRAYSSVKATLTSQIESPLGIKVPPATLNFIISDFDARARLGGIPLEECFEYNTKTEVEGLPHSHLRKLIENIGNKLKDPKKYPLFFKEFIANCTWMASPSQI